MPKMRTDDGVEIHYHVHDFRDPWITDPGDTILLSHGFSRSMKWWNQWVPGLSRKYRVVRYDVRGCGESSVPAEGAIWSPERLARDALNLIDHLSIDKVHWVGFESGGIWGTVFAATYSDRIKSLTVANTPLAAGEPLTTGYTSELINEKGLRQWLIDTNANRMDLSIADAQLMEWHLAEQSKTSTAVAASIMGILETLDLSSRYFRVLVPTLIMVGDSNPVRSLESQRSMQQRIPNARLVVFPSIGAGFHLLMPDRCVEELLRFLE